ncbi:formate dehydrogenase accessory sulfurtransferase FdhD, partial [Psychrobacter sp.]
DIYVVELVLSQRCHQRIQAQKRQLAGRTGCGMCGITGLTQALPDLSTYSQDHLHHEHNRQTGINGIQTSAPSLDSLLALRQQVDAAQHTHQLTGAVHAAATIHNQQLHLFEDVGRHNALDKLIGWQLRQKADVSCVLMTSRLSIELVQKSIRSQIPWLVGMSAPTSTAVRVAERYGLGLAGFLRDNRVTYYTKQDNI